LVHWAKPISGLCSSGEQHFDQLVAAAGLRSTAKDNHVSKNTLRSWISEAAHRLREIDPARIELDRPSPGHIPFEAPLAWKNGAWNFAFPWSFDTDKELDSQIRDLIGQLATALDDTAKAAVLYFVPDSSRERVLKELAYVEGRIPGTRTSELHRRNGEPDTTGLEAMVRADVESSALLGN
jgi:hypothetical protein